MFWKWIQIKVIRPNLVLKMDPDPGLYTGLSMDSDVFVQYVPGSIGPKKGFWSRFWKWIQTRSRSSKRIYIQFLRRIRIQVHGIIQIQFLRINPDRIWNHLSKSQISFHNFFPLFVCPKWTGNFSYHFYFNLNIFLLFEHFLINCEYGWKSLDV